MILFKVKKKEGSFIQENHAKIICEWIPAKIRPFKETGWEGGLSYKIDNNFEKNRQFQQR